MKLLTIFTPTYNRAKLLPRLYISLCQQTYTLFEWIIVDDGSIDDTETIINDFINSKNNFPIYYYKQEHGGKHRAINLALKYAKGDYFFIVDSDDYIISKAVEMINNWTEDIKNISYICGVSGLKEKSSGEILDNKCMIWNTEYIEASNLERDKLQLTGDKAEVYSTEVMRQYPFPEFEGEYFVTENVCWNAIAADGYKLRWYNMPIYICDYLQDGLTKSGINERTGHIKNFNGYSYYVRQSMKVRPIIDSITEFREYNRTCKDMNKPLGKRAKNLKWNIIKYFWYLLVKMPFWYFIRILKFKLLRIN